MPDDDIGQVEACFRHCADKTFPDVSMGNGACNSDIDSTYAPADGHSAGGWPFAPYAVDGDQAPVVHEGTLYLALCRRPGFGSTNHLINQCSAKIARRQMRILLVCSPKTTESWRGLWFDLIATVNF